MRALLLSFALLPLLAGAQSWCPPGAEWTYGVAYSGYFGYYRYFYSGDTVLAGSIGKRLSISGETSVIASGEITSTFTEAACVTRAYQDVVEIWDDDIQAWDTLYWYRAVPGSTWKRPFDSGTCGPDERLVVLDTGHVIVSGVTLAYWDVEQHWEGGITGPTRIIERLGWLPELLFIPACYNGEELAGLRCYSDEEMAVYFVEYPCRSLVGMDEPHGAQQVVPFPNPGTIHFTLDLPSGPHTITLFDATGRLVLQQPTTEARPVIATETLPAGLYRIAVRDERGVVMGATWVKE